MSHLTCPKCGSKEHTIGYGLAAGPMGGYTYCDGCDELLEFWPELTGLSEEDAKAILTSVEEWRKRVWGEKA